jgi:hypothetical protein
MGRSQPHEETRGEERRDVGGMMLNNVLPAYFKIFDWAQGLSLLYGF